MSSPRSRYVSDAAPDYSHRFHAGNVGDVWKHCALVEVLRGAAAVAPRLAYVETHAGEGSYALGATGEWSEGIGRLWTDDELGTGAVARYVALCRRLGAGAARPERYPGSPLLARAVLGPDASLTLWEREREAFARLATRFGGDAHARLVRGDGIAALSARGDPPVGGVRGRAHASGAGDAASITTVVLIDPSWTQKADWTVIPQALTQAARAADGTAFILWYPVKSLTRPNAMHAALERAGVAATIVEVITTSLKHQRNRLNGSGVLLVRPPAGAVEELAAAGPVVGRLCATRPGVWSCRVQAW